MGSVGFGFGPDADIHFALLVALGFSHYIRILGELPNFKNECIELDYLESNAKNKVRKSKHDVA
jgi:dimeric dUTPase (all-alpha-NTP-PPase superfamily)